jgi:hypothetical protein
MGAETVLKGAVIVRTEGIEADAVVDVRAEAVVADVDVGAAAVVVADAGVVVRAAVAEGRATNAAAGFTDSRRS